MNNPLRLLVLLGILLTPRVSVQAPTSLGSDNFAVATAVAEPSTYAMRDGLGASGLAL